VRNDDWGNNWILDDTRVNLIGCDEKRFVRFIDLLINPTIQSDKVTTEKLATLINRELNKAGYRIEKGEVRLGAPDRNAAIGTSTTIGVGGFGRVRIAKVNGVVVAIKELLPELRQDEDACGRFAYEIATLKKLKGMPGVVKIIDESVGGDRFAFSMECAQSNLEEYIIRNPSLSQIARAALIADVCAYMNDIHDRGVVHRDICPRNVLMFDVRPKITDFGLAMDRERVSGLTRTSARIGKEPYMAPEVQDSLLNATEISDVYALGRLLQFALTNEEPLGEPDQPGIGVFSSIIRHATAQSRSHRIQDPGVLSTSIRDMIQALTAQDRITSLVEYAASIEGGLTFDSEMFHLLVMESSTDEPYDSFWDPVIEILNRKCLKEYVDWAKNAQIIDFVRVCQRQYDALPSVGWPFSSANSMTDLVLSSGVVSGNISALKLAFEFAWRIGIFGNQFASRDQVVGYLVKEGRAMTDDMIGHVVSVIQRYRLNAVIDESSINRMHPTVKSAIRNRISAENK
jgi:serine/threonine protein kinase